MHEGLRILDADRHVIEPIGMWKHFVAPEFREGAPYPELLLPRESLEERVRRLGPRGLLPLAPTMMLDGEPVMRGLSEEAQLETAWLAYQRPGLLEAGASAQGQLRTMEASGVDVAFLYPSFGLWLLAVEGLRPARASAFMRAYNDWLRDFCRADPERLRGVGMLSLHAPEALVAEAERVAAWGWKAVVLPPNPVQGRTLGDPAYAPFWSACERLSLAVILHEGTHARLPSAGADRFRTRFAQHACSHPMEQMMAFLALVEGGVLERHPGLRVAFLEAGCGWVPYWLWRLDEVAYRYMGGEVAEHVRQKPSEYFRRQCFVSVEPGEPYLADVIARLGPGNLLFGSDFPHVDHEGDALEELLGTGLPEAVLRQLLWDNPARLYGL